MVVGGGVSAPDSVNRYHQETILSKSTLSHQYFRCNPQYFGGMAGVIGAAALVVDEVFSHERVFEMVNQEGMA